MALEQRAGGAEFGQNLLFGHRISRIVAASRSDREGAVRASSVRQWRRNMLERPGVPAYKAPPARRPGARIQPSARRAHRGLDEDFFQARRHCRRLRPGARRGAGRAGAARRRGGRSPPRRPTSPARWPPMPPPRRRAPRLRRRDPRRAGQRRRGRRPASASPTAAWACRTRSRPIGEEAAWFHDVILMPLITVISLFVLLLLAWVIVPLPPRRQSDAVAQHPQHHARDRLDAGAGADPGGDRGAVDPAARPPI